MPVVDEEAGDSPRSRVEVLVGAPGGEVDAPVVEPQGHVADGVGQVEAHGRARSVRGPGDAPHVEQLPGVVVDAADHHQGDARSLRLQVGFDLGLVEQVPFISEGDHGLGGIESVEAGLALDGVAVRGERTGLDEDPGALPGRAVEGHHG